MVHRCLLAPGGVKGPGEEVGAFDRGSLGGRMAFGSDCSVVAGVEGLDRVRGANHFTDLVL